MQNQIFFFVENKNAFYKHLKVHTANNVPKSLKGFEMALVGIPDDRNSINKGTAQAPNAIRNKLYQLTRNNRKVKLIDLGNLKPGNTIMDTYFAIRDVVTMLNAENIFPILLGGSQDLTYGTFLSHCQNDKQVSIVTIDSRLDFQPYDEELGSFSYLNKIFEERNKIFDFTNLGHQSYYVTNEELNLLNRMDFSSMRLGMVRSALSEAEPIIRDATMISIDISSARYAEAPGYFNPSPHGFLGEELCQLSRYAGLNADLKSFGIYEINPLYDQQDVTANLAAQMIWYFIDGFSVRRKEYPDKDTNFKKYIVNLSGNSVDEDIIFYKSELTDRWWMELQLGNNPDNVPFFAACSDDDYKKACLNEIPERLMYIVKKKIV